MQPLAYGLRDHEIFETPFAVATTDTTEIPTPPYFSDDLDEQVVSVLPLTNDDNIKHQDGWCTYTYAIHGCPELEVFCGGVNDKTPRAGAVWRQGHLLHFGFEPPPSAFNENGKAMLTNCIAYISRFTEDRPIIKTPSPFQSDIRYFDRGVLTRIAEKGEESFSRLRYYTTEQTYADLRNVDVASLMKWIEKNSPYLYPGKAGKLRIDEEAITFGAAPASFQFLATAIQRLDQEDELQLAVKLLDRYVPDGPADRSNSESWRQWHAANKEYLFFSESGGYRWYIDPLAKKRKLPTRSLRGAKRASKAGIEFQDLPRISR